MKYTVRDMEQLAKQRNFRFLSTEYFGIVKKHEWMCPNGHTWFAVPNNIKNGSGCPKCSHARPRKTLDYIKSIVRDRGFHLISTTFLGMKKKHLWRCRDGHEWLASPQNIKTTGCPKCSGSIREEQVRFIFESLLNKKFPRDRSKLNGMELDGYCKDLNLAFEYNGEQHYRDHYLNGNNVKNIKIADRKKKKMCSIFGITVIYIPYTKRNCLEEFIRSKLTNMNLKVGNIDWSKFIGKPSKLNELRSIALLRGGEVVSEQYLGSHEKHAWKCKKCQHVWWAVAKDVVSGSWCPRCAKNQKYSMEDIGSISLDRGFEFCSTAYSGMNTPHLFKCRSCSYKWTTKPNRIQQGAKCPSCREGRDKRNANKN